MERLLEKRTEAGVRVLADDVLPAASPHLGEPSSVPEQLSRRPRELLCGEAGEHDTAAGGLEKRLWTAARSGEDGDSRRERLRRDDSEAFLERRDYEDGGPPQVIGHRGDNAGRLDTLGQRAAGRLPDQQRLGLR